MPNNKQQSEWPFRQQLTGENGTVIPILSFDLFAVVPILLFVWKSITEAHQHLSYKMNLLKDLSIDKIQNLAEDA